MALGKTGFEISTKIGNPQQCPLKRYSSGQSHFSETNVNWLKKNEFATRFAQRCLETRENEQKQNVSDKKFYQWRSQR